MTGCPLCAASPSLLETLSRGYRFCGRCGFVFLVDAQGVLVDVAPTNHTTVGRRAAEPSAAPATPVDLSKMQSNPQRRRADMTWRKGEDA